MPRKHSTSSKQKRAPRFNKGQVADRIDQVFRELFKHRGMTLADIATTLEVDRSLPGKWIKKGQNASTPSGEQLAKIAFAFDVSIDWLLTGHGPDRRSALMEQCQLEQALAERLEVAIYDRLRRDGRAFHRPRVNATRLLEWLTDRGVEEAKQLDSYRHYSNAVAIAQQIHELGTRGPEAIPALVAYAQGKALEGLAYGAGEMDRPETNVLHWDSTSLTNPTP